MSIPSNMRRFFRLGYPVNLRPTMILEGVEYQITEISEGGLRFHFDEFNGLRIGEGVIGTIQFSDGEQVDISGIIYRRDRDEYVIASLRGVTFKRIVMEQRIMIMRTLTVRADSD